MTQEKARFSPAQVLMAAEKAEADGRLDYAVQFYRYITDKDPESPEAVLARSALDRLAQNHAAARSSTQPPRPAARPAPVEPGPASAADYAVAENGQTPTPYWPPAPPPRSGFSNSPGASSAPSSGRPTPFTPTSIAGYTNGGDGPAHSAPRNTVQSANPFPGSLPSNSQLHGPPFPGPATAGSEGLPQFEAAQARRPEPPAYPPARMPVLINLPRRKRGYRAGRALATMTMIGGIAFMMIGFGLVFVALFANKLLAMTSPPVPDIAALAIGAGLIVFGPGLIFLGQLARAVFDAANAARELVAIERAIARQTARVNATPDEE